MILKGEIQIGGSINVRTEMHGEENVAAMDIPCAILIKRKQLRELLREDLADSLLFKSQNQEHFEPVFQGKIGPIPLLGKFKKSAVSFKCGVDEAEIDFEDCALSKLRIDPQIGGMTLLKFTVQAHLTDEGKSIFDWANTTQPGSIKTGKFHEEAKNDQPELPLGEPAAGPADDGAGNPVVDANAAPGEAENPAAAESAPGKKKRIRKSRAKAARK
jgi:hypothetical protein